MNWDAIAAIGQMLGSVAVLVTLGYLAVQVKHSRQDARRALSQGRSDVLRGLQAQQIDERINRLWVKANAAFGAPTHPINTALMDHAGLTAEEANLLFWNLLSWWTYRLSIIPNVDELTAIERTQFDSHMRFQYGRPGVARVFFEAFKSGAHPDAVGYIDNLLAQPG